MKTFRAHYLVPSIVTVAAVVVGFLYGGAQTALLVAILGAMEVSLSFDNAIVNARVIEKLSPKWRKIFLTAGLAIAVLGMRFILPVLLVVATTGLAPAKVVSLALAKGNPTHPGTFGYYLTQAHPQIAAFGGMFLLLLFLEFMFEDREIMWLTWLEKPLAKVGQLDALAYAVAGGALIVAGSIAEHPAKVFVAGLCGIVAYILVNGLGSLFEGSEEGIHGSSEDIADGMAGRGPAGVTKLVGKAAFFMFLYLEVLDSSFSFDGVIGAFAITADPIVIALGLGVIGALFVRSLTVHMVEAGTLDAYVYLDHGAHWSIGALAGLLIASIGCDIPDVVTGLIGVVLIGAAVITSHLRNKRIAKQTLLAAV
ncbi:DUF475 domain-containing protein [Curtobacterium sp. MCBD17_040]|uniref:DUF475 domain-containing protein n=1 Tax=Curtobacterium sp. MCBD17_040 TaxID=2175674 RepID=UPI0021AD0FC6|nr:DUF475 domain-containing protein [Curtobacterium sp. MCBD17_040]WIB65395.1 DUF475 domain-containing protein [Curtobacterium sp. MCBD17_040]